MKIIVDAMVIVLFIVPHYGYSQTSDTLSKKETEFKSNVSSNFKLGLLIGLGNPQGVRLGLCSDVGYIRFGGGFGLGSTILTALFAVGEIEYATSGFVEFPKLLLNKIDNLGIGLSFSHLVLTLNRVEIQDYLGVYFFQDYICTQNTLFSVGIGYDRIIKAIPSLPPSQSGHALHIDAKVHFTMYRYGV